jgi:RNA polymerase sigma-70 factor (ECF subfamily)
VEGLLALMLLHDARRDARTAPDGSLVLLADQDRARWDRPAIDEGRQVLERALTRRGPGPYQVQAAIAAVHADAPTADATDWHQIVLLYEELLGMTPSPVVELNLAVAVAMRDGPAVGLALTDAVAADGRLDDYVYLHAARGDLLRRLERWSEATAAYAHAAALASNATERRFLEGRLAEVSGRAGRPVRRPN